MNRYLVYYLVEGKRCQTSVRANNEDEACNIARSNLSINCTILNAVTIYRRQ